MSSFNAVIVDPAIQGRSLVKSAARALKEFVDLLPVATIEEALGALAGGKHWDIVFLSSRTPDEARSRLFQECSKRQLLSSLTFILVTKSDEVTRDNIAVTLGEGFNGVLCEPFSAEQLRQCAETAAKLQLGAGRDRVKTALAIIIPTLAQKIRATAPDKKEAKPAVASQRERLIQTCNRLTELCTYVGSSYAELINEIFDEIELDARASHTAASRRLQGRLVNQLALSSELRNELLALEKASASASSSHHLAV